MRNSVTAVGNINYADKKTKIKVAYENNVATLLEQKRSLFHSH